MIKEQLKGLGNKLDRVVESLLASSLEFISTGLQDLWITFARI